MHPVLLLLRAGVCCIQSLSTFPEKVSVSNLKAVGALKNVGKGTMERVRGMVLIRTQEIFRGCPVGRGRRHRAALVGCACGEASAIGGIFGVNAPAGKLRLCTQQTCPLVAHTHVRQQEASCWGMSDSAGWFCLMWSCIGGTESSPAVGHSELQSELLANSTTFNFLNPLLVHAAIVFLQTNNCCTRRNESAGSRTVCRKQSSHCSLTERNLQMLQCEHTWY
jgi:hypothetical protein